MCAVSSLHTKSCSRWPAQPPVQPRPAGAHHPHGRPPRRRRLPTRLWRCLRATAPTPALHWTCCRRPCCCWGAWAGRWTCKVGCGGGGKQHKRQAPLLATICDFLPSILMLGAECLRSLLQPWQCSRPRHNPHPALLCPRCARRRRWHHSVPGLRLLPGPGAQGGAARLADAAHRPGAGGHARLPPVSEGVAVAPWL